MACRLSEVKTKYVPLQNVEGLNMARGLSEVANKYGLRSEVTTEYVPLQNVSWLNMACGLSEVVTEYGLWAV